MHDEDISRIIELIAEALKSEKLPIVSELAEQKRNPFQILISTILSLRTKDEVTEVASRKLFARASTPHEMLKLTEDQIINAIYPVGFYRNKTKTILHVSKELIEKHNSRVPDTMEELLSLKGVGRKTANLVITLGYQGRGICVDTHVHRISNRLGYVETKTPEETEFALRDKLPQNYWIQYNTLLVAFGRTVCKPVSPLCSKCPVISNCNRVGVTKSR
ncbi:MAG: endonuclease III [Deltaproteobacteria bacterium]|nr:endonuclease III [Deltaproteobacteria bacterium]